MVKYGKMQKVVMSVLVAMLIASLFLAIVAIVLPTPAMALGCSGWDWLGCDCPNSQSRWMRSCSKTCWDPQFGWTICSYYQYKCTPDC